MSVPSGQSDSNPTNRWPKPVRWTVWGCIGLAFVGVIGCCTPMHEALDPRHWLVYLEQSGHWAIALFLLAHIIATVLAIPGTVLVIAGGATFGLLWGTVLSVIGATLGAIAAFLITRYCLRAWMLRQIQQTKRYRKLWQWANRLSDRQALSCVLALRFVPIAPFNIINFVLGVTPLSVKTYAIGTSLGIIPGTLAYTWLGLSGRQVVQGGQLQPFFLALSGLALLSILPLLWQRCQPNLSQH